MRSCSSHRHTGLRSATTQRERACGGATGAAGAARHMRPAARRGAPDRILDRDLQRDEMIRLCMRLVGTRLAMSSSDCSAPRR